MLFDNDGNFVAADTLSLSCSIHLNWTGVPSEWPSNCSSLPGEKCTTLPDASQVEAANMIALASDAPTEYSLGDTLTFQCNTDYVLADDPTSNSHTIQCQAESDGNGGFQMSFSGSQPWPDCVLASSTTNKRRKKREFKIDGVAPRQYQYINVVIDVQFNNESVAYEDVA